MQSAPHYGYMRGVDFAYNRKGNPPIGISLVCFYFKFEIVFVLYIYIKFKLL